MSCSSAVPPPNSSVNSRWKWELTTENDAEQALAGLAVEALDALAQPLDRLDEIVALGDEGGVLGLDLAQFLVGAQVDGAEPLAVALELLQLRLDFRDVWKRRVRFEAGEARQRLRLGFQDLADFGGEVGEPPLDALVPLFCAHRGFACRREGGMGGACRAVGLGKAVLAGRQHFGRGPPRGLRGLDLGDERTALCFELLRRIDEAGMLAAGLGEARLDGRGLRRGAFPPLGPGGGIGCDCGEAALGKLDLAGERLGLGAHFGEPAAVGGDGGADLREFGLQCRGGRQVRPAQARRRRGLPGSPPAWW